MPKSPSEADIVPYEFPKAMKEKLLS